LLAYAPGGDFVFAQAILAAHIGAAKAQAAHIGHRGQLIKDDQGVLIGLVLQAPAPALFGHQALGKGPVGFSELGGDGAHRPRLGLFQT
jgi:hypothetical protein